MKRFLHVPSLSLAALVLGLGVGCNHAQKQHLIEQEAIPCTTCATASSHMNYAPVPEMAPPTVPASMPAPMPTPSALPTAPTQLPPVADAGISNFSSSAKFNDDASGRSDVNQRRSYADITADTRFAHASDYSWLVGKLQYIHGKDQWRVRFASVDEEDRLGGSVTLQGMMRDVENLKDGTMVRVEGILTNAESRAISPNYRVTTITPLR